eukprot:SAG22_NODE_1984_length_3206_cov_2.186675_5_plen_95_part_00
MFHFCVGAPAAPPPQQRDKAPQAVGSHACMHEFREFFSRILFGADLSYGEYGEIETREMPVSKTACQNSYWFGRKKIAKLQFHHYCDCPSMQWT